MTQALAVVLSDSMLRFPLLHRRKQWVAVAAVVIVLPVVVFYVLERRREELIAGLGATDVRVTPISSPLVKSVLDLFGARATDLPKFFWHIEVPEIVHIQWFFADSDLQGAARSLGQLRGVRSIEFSGDGNVLEPEDLRAFQQLRQLQNLDVTRVYGLNDDRLAAIAAIESLRSLALGHGGSFTAQGLQALAALPRLERLQIECERREDFLAIAELKTLRELNLGDSLFLHPKSLQPLKTLPALERLQFSGNRKAVPVIAEMTSLRELQMDEMLGLEVEQLRPLTALPRLERLSVVEGTRQMESMHGSFERKLVPTFQAMHALKELRIGTSGGYPTERVQELRNALPDVNVVVVDTESDPAYKDRRW